MRLIASLILTAFGLFAQAIPNQWFVNDMAGNTSNSVAECLKPANFSVSGGLATFTAKSETLQCGDSGLNLTTYNYTSAMIMWNTLSFQYGVIEARIAFAGNTGLWPALWMQGQGNSAGSGGSGCQGVNKLGFYTPAACQWPNPGSDEIDIAEVIGSSVDVNEQIHSNGHNDGCTAAPSGGVTGFHVYRLEWSSGSMVWKVDGTTTCTITQAYVPSSYMFMMFTFDLGGVTGTPTGLPATSQIDYVRVCPVGTTTCDVAHASIFDEEWNGTGPLSSVAVGQSFIGQETGLTSADRFGVLNNQQVSWPNDAGFWTNGQIGPGTTINIYGTVSTTLTAQGSGTAQNPIIFCQQAGSSSTVNTNSQSNILVLSPPCLPTAPVSGIKSGGVCSGGVGLC